jgi:flagella basal body P-ring formation protein FlgA
MISAGEKPSITPEHIKKVVTAYVEQHLQNDFTDVVVEYRSVPAPVIPAPGECVVQVSPAFGIPQKGFTGIPVEIRKDGRLIKTIVCSVLIRTFENAFVAAQSIEKNQIITPLIFLKENIETTRMNEEVMKELDGLHEYRTRRMVTANSIMTQSMIEEVPSVRMNEPVVVCVVAGNVYIEIGGIAKEDGKIGDEIRVVRNGMKEILIGTVVGKQKVEIVTP